MWTWALWPWATQAPPPAGTSDALITAAAGIIIALISGLVAVVTLLFRNRDRDPPAGSTPPEPRHGERLAVLEHRADGTDETGDAADRLLAGQGDMLDGHGDTLDDHERRITSLEAWRDRRHPGWRNG